MQLKLVLLSVLLCSVLVYSQAPTQIYLLSNSDGNVTFSIVDVITGDIIKETQFGTDYVYAYSMVEATEDSVKIIANDFKNGTIALYSYTISTDKFSLGSQCGDISYSFQLQPFGFDSSLNTAYIAGTYLAANATIIYFDFATQEQSSITSDLTISPGSLPSGCYDQNGNDFYITYYDAQYNRYLSIYDFDEKSFSDPISLSSLGTNNGFYFYANDNLYAVLNSYPNITLNTIDTLTGDAELVLSVPSTFEISDLMFVNNNNYVVLITSNVQGQAIYVTVDLSTYDIVSTSNPNTPVYQAYILAMA